MFLNVYLCCLVMNKKLLVRYDDFFGNSCSKKLLECQKQILGNEFIRVNMSRKKIIEVAEFLKKNRVRYEKTMFNNAFKIKISFFNLSSSLECLKGDFYLQDLASQIPVNLIDFNRLKNLGRQVNVLDMAASPGSKTTQIADLLEYYGIDYKIVCLEPDKKRLLRLINNIQKQGFTNIEVYNEFAQDFKTENSFDVILLDAPCSGNLAGDRDWLKKRDLTGIIDNSNIQKEILKNAVKLLSESGILIYSTCSLEVEENELNISFAQKELNLKSFFSDFSFGFETDSLKLIKDRTLLKEIGDVKCMRIMPYLSGTQGFFVCCLKK